MPREGEKKETRQGTTLDAKTSLKEGKNDLFF